MKWQEYKKIRTESGKLIDKNINWNLIRGYRNDLLNESDYLIIKYMEQELPLPEDIKIYRKKLRDITTDFVNPEDVIFPDKPESI